MQPLTPLAANVLDWSGRLTDARTLGQLAAALVEPPGLPAEPLTGVLLLLDPRHELRRLTGGDERHAEPLPGLCFVDSLSGVAPGYGTLHTPWSGAYHASDHGLLIGAETGCRHLLLLPLPRTGGLTGVYNIGSLAGPVSLASLEARWLELIAAQALVNSERQLQRARLLRAGVVDPLTGWNSRHYFLARVREQVAAGERHGEPATCLVIDVDGLGAINDRHGVAAGDAAVFEVGSVLEAQVRASDAFAHLGEDEFAVLLPATTPMAAAQLAERILRAVRDARGNAPLVDEQPLKVSVGIAGLDMAAPKTRLDRKATADEWLARAHAALHQAKRAGGDRYAAV
ncbi:MAG: diguanylate cyclase domain-containing protein [Steroidobacteraceae bacterium]